MFFFFHVFAGIVLALLLAQQLHDSRIVLPCIIGAFLPDLIDKPLGYLLFADSVGNGRILLHNLFLVLILLAIGCIAWKRMARPEVFAFTVGLISHQILDLMWTVPENWLFPFYGPLTYKGGSDIAHDLLQDEISLGSEWVVAIGILSAVLLLLITRHTGSTIPRHRPLVAGLLLAGTFMFVVLATGAFVAGICGTPFTAQTVYTLFGWLEPAQSVAGGIVFFMAAYLLWSTRRRLLAAAPGQGCSDRTGLNCFQGLL